MCMLISNQIRIRKFQVIMNQTDIFGLIALFIEVIKAYPFILTKCSLLNEVYLLCQYLM